MRPQLPPPPVGLINCKTFLATSPHPPNTLRRSLADSRMGAQHGRPPAPTLPLRPMQADSDHVVRRGVRSSGGGPCPAPRHAPLLCMGRAQSRARTAGREHFAAVCISGRWGVCSGSRGLRLHDLSVGHGLLVAPGSPVSGNHTHVTGMLSACGQPGNATG